MVWLGMGRREKVLMNQIAIGDPIKGFIVLDGQSVAIPNFKATLALAYSSDPYLKESIAIEYRGSPAQIQDALSKLEVIIQRAVLYDHVSYASPQYLRFQLAAGGPYYYTPISNLYLSANPAGYRKQQIGSLVVYLFYTRPNYFDGPQQQLTLSGRAGTHFPGWYPLRNHTGPSAGAGSTVLIDKTHITTVLPAPVRFEYVFDSAGAARLKDLYVGIFHHPAYDGDLPFFAYHNSLSGGSQHANASAINGHYRSVTWSSGGWFDFTKYLIDTTFIAFFDGRSFRPVLRLFATHAYTDLYFRVQVERYGDVLYISEPIYSPPNTGYIILPPIDLPPNYLLREKSPARVQIALYARRISGASTTIQFDCLTVFPLAYAATFHGFFNLQYDQTLIDDSHRQRHNAHLVINNQETVAHSRIGGDLLLFPNEHSRIFFYCTNHEDQMPPTYQAALKVYYRPRLRLL